MTRSPRRTRRGKWNRSVWAGLVTRTRRGCGIVTYDIVLDAVDLGIGLIRTTDLVEVVLDPVHTENANLLECPPADLLGKVPVEGLGGLSIDCLDLGVEPCVLEHLGRTDESEPGGVARLESRDQCQLLACAKEVIDYLGLLLGVVAVGGARGTEDGRQEFTCSKSGANTTGEGNDLVLCGTGTEKVLDIGSDGSRCGEEDDVVLFSRVGRVVVEVVDDETGAVGWQVDVELGE